MNPVDLKKFAQGNYSFHPSLFDNISLGQPLPPFDNPSLTNPMDSTQAHIVANQPIVVNQVKRKVWWL